MERYHIYKLGLAILFYAVYFARQTVVNGLKIDDVTSRTNTTDYRERRDSGDDGFFYQGADGTPGVDFPTLSYVPRTKFSCRDMEAGYYADLETDCQVFHICDEGRKLSFLCPNGTTFHQSELICDWWFKVNCSNSPSLYEESAEILQRENAKRKDSRRLSYQGTKQGVFSNNEDYGQHTFGGTPAHFVTPSYRTAVKTVDNRISATTEGIIRSNYNSRGDRTLASFGNGVQEKDFTKTNPFLNGRSQSFFDNNLQGKLRERDQTGFSTNTQQKASTVGSFSRDSHSPIKSGSFGLNTFGTTGRAESAGRVTFGTNKQPDSFSRNVQQTTSGRNQNAFGTNSQTSIDGNTQKKSETGKQATFGTGTRYHTDESASPTPDDISSLQTTYEHGQNTFGARLQGGVSKFGGNDFGENLQGKTETNGQSSFGFDTYKKTGGVASQIPLDRTAQKASGVNANSFGRGQGTFGRSTQQTTSRSASSLDRSSQRTGDGSENLFGRGQVTFGSGIQQTTGGSGTASQIPLNRSSQKAIEANQNIFSGGQVTFGTNNQQTVGSSASQIPLDRTAQRLSETGQNVFGRGQATFGAGTQQTTSGSGTASKIPLDRSSQKAVEANQNIFGRGGVAFGTNNQQTVGSSASQIPLDRSAQRIGKTDQNVFGRGQIAFGAGTQQTTSGSASQIPLDRSSQKVGVGNQNIFGGGRVTFGVNNQQTVGGSASQIPFGRTTQTISENNQNILGGGQVTFNGGTQQSTSGSQIPKDRSSQKADAANQNIFGGGRVTFGTNNRQTVGGTANQISFDRTTETVSDGNENTFAGGRIKIGTNNQQTVDGSLSQKASEGNQNVFSGQVSFGASTQQSVSGSVNQHPLDRNSQKAIGYHQTLFGSGQSAFGTSTQKTASGRESDIISGKSSQKIAEHDQKIFGGGQITFGRDAQQTVGSNVDQKTGGRDQNRFVNSFNDKIAVIGQKPVQYENAAIGVNVQQTLDNSKFNQNLNGYLGNGGQSNVFGKDSSGFGLNTGDGFDKIKFSISSEGKSDEFDTSKQKSGSDYQQNHLNEPQQITSIKDSQVTVSGAGQNRFDISSSGKSGIFDQTTSSFGLKSSTFGVTSQSEEDDDGGKIPVLIVSAETQEPQETASFVKSGRNNLLDMNKQGVTNPYPNHRETYSDIKDPRHYYQQPQSKLPEKPFYGSSVSPQVLSTVPVTAYDSSSKTTTEVNLSKESIKSDFELRADISTKRPSVGVDSTTTRSHDSHVGFTAFAPFKDSEQFSTGKSPATTNRFSFGLSTSQPAKSSIGLDLDRQPIEISTNGELNNFGQTTIQPTTRSVTIDSNKVDVTTYDRGYTDGIDVSLNSVSSTLLPDITEDIEGKSTVYPGSYSTKYYEGKSSTSAGGLNHFGFGGTRTTEKPFANSPIIKLKIQPSTATPEFESSTRSGKSFNVDSPKTQVITLNGSKVKDYRKGPFEATGNDGRRISISFGSGQQGPIGTSVVSSGGETVSPGFITVKGNGNGNTFRVITGVNITPTIKFNKFGGTTAGPDISSRSSSTSANEYERNFVSSTPSAKETSFSGKGTDININNHLHTFPESDRDNLGVTLAGGNVNVDVQPSTRATPTEKEMFEFTINDEVFTTPTPATISTETIAININDENYSTPTSVYSTTVQGVSDNTVTTASPSEEENASFTSPSSVLQPKPFSVSTESRYDSSSKTAVTSNKTVVEQSGTQVPPYTISSASPFATTLKPIGDLGSNTLTPTAPTPFTTESPLLYSYKPTDENINNMINTLMEVMKQRFGGNDIGFGTPRPGLVVPPSAGPQTLHSFAIYFANALDNLTASSHREVDEQGDDESGTDSPIIHIDNEELIKSLLTQMTRNNYENLFKEKDATTTELPFSLRSGADENQNDLIREDTKHPTEGPGVRQLARVFTEALSAYLEDPDTFKKVLHDVRPTEPPLLAFGTETSEAEDDEVLNYSDSDLKSDHPHLPSRPTGIPVSPTWGYLLAFNKSSSANDNLETQNSLSTDKENLQSADSQSFVSQLNKVTQEFKTTLALDGSTEASHTDADNEDTGKTLPENHWTTSSDVTKLWQTTLSINPALLNENFDSPQSAQGVTSPDVGTRFSAVTSSEENSSGTGTPRVSEIQYELRALPKLQLNSTQVHGILIDFMNASKTEGSGKLQRILHKLNISQDEFLDKMKEIEGNPLTRRLILLLISECNTDKNKELESRAASSDSVFGLAESKLNSDNTEQPAATSRRLRSGTDDLPTTESNFYKHIVHPSLDDDDEDTRALELLNSLYVIASKFGK